MRQGKIWVDWVWSKGRSGVVFWFSIGHLEKVLGSELWAGIVNLRVFV